MASPVYTIKVDYQEQTRRFAVACSSSETPILRAYLYDSKDRWQGDSDWTSQLAYCASGYDTNNAPETIDGTVSSSDNYVDFSLSDITQNNTYGDFYSQVVLFNNSAGDSLQFVFGAGSIRVKKSPISNGV